MSHSCIKTHHNSLYFQIFWLKWLIFLVMTKSFRSLWLKKNPEGANLQLASHMWMVLSPMQLLHNYQKSHEITCIKNNLKNSVIVMLVCDTYNKCSWAKVRVLSEEEMGWCSRVLTAHVYVTFCSNTVRNVALGLWLVGYPWSRFLPYISLYCTIYYILSVKISWP